MTHTELKQVILGYFRNLYECEYIGLLKIEDLNPGYKISLYPNKSEYPIVIAADYYDDEFLVYLYQELRAMKLHKTKYYSLTKI